MTETRSPAIQVGLEGFTFPDLDPFAIVDLAAATGYSQAGVRLMDPATNRPTVSIDDAHRLRGYAIEHGITLYGADLVDLEAPPDGWPASLAALSAAGVTRLGAFHRGGDLTAASRRFADLVAVAGRCDVTPHLEPVSYFGVDSITAVGEFIADAGSGGLTIDTLHFARRGDDLDRLAELAATVPIWLQLCDGPALEDVVPVGASPDERLAALRHESIADRRPPGTGAFRVADLVRTVREAVPRAELVLMVEAPDHERVLRIGAAAYATVCRDAVDDIIAQATSREDHA